LKLRIASHMRATTEAIAVIVVGLRSAAVVARADARLLRRYRGKHLFGSTELRHTEIHASPQQDQNGRQLAPQKMHMFWILAENFWQRHSDDALSDGTPG
jgi:hypothetical protein